jgi:hypothetical protein
VHAGDSDCTPVAPPGGLRSGGAPADAVAQERSDAEGIVGQCRVVAGEYLDGGAPFREDVAVRALVLDFLFHHAIMLKEWADRAEATIGPGAGRSTTR